MFHSNPIVSASFSVALAAGVAGIFTIATDTSASDRTAVTRPGVVDRPDLRSIYFDAQPIAGRGKLVKDNAPSVKLRGVVSEEIVPERTNEMQKRPMMNGCESGLSPDISSNVPTKARRCLT